MKKSKRIGFYIIVTSIVLSVTIVCSSCLSAIANGIISAFSNALSFEDNEDKSDWVENTNITNNVNVTFIDGTMYSTWDVTTGYTYSLDITKEGNTESYDENSSSYETGKLNLNNLGYIYSDDLTVKLTKKNTYTNQVKTYFYTYNGLTNNDYIQYTKCVSAGIKEIDYYIASRKELFDLWSYLIIFRDGATYNSKEKGYVLDKNVYMAYNYTSLYSNVTKSEAFKFELYSAMAAFEDSCAYGYGYEMNSDGVHGEISVCVYSTEDPIYTTSTNKKYVNVYSSKNYTGYDRNTGLYIADKEPLILERSENADDDAEITRSFAIDKITRTARVSTSDELYYVIKFGYKPECKKGSNAELLYNKMREILNWLIKDDDTPEYKVLYLYEYIVATVLYDYEFCDTVCDDDSISSGDLLSYKCMYLEGVFGLTNDGTFEKSERVAICDGLSKAFMCLATIEGIPAYKISGTVSDEGHAWNKVYVNNNWYLVDTTWGNDLTGTSQGGKAEESISYNYLLVADDNRHMETAYRNYPKTTNTSQYQFPEIRYGSSTTQPSFPWLRPRWYR